MKHCEYTDNCARYMWCKLYKEDNGECRYLIDGKECSKTEEKKDENNDKRD
jgi:hypothetical protein